MSDRTDVSPRRRRSEARSSGARTQVADTRRSAHDEQARRANRRRAHTAAQPIAAATSPAADPTPATTTPSRGRYVTSLDGLRAICMVGVLLYHIGLRWASGGLLGVTVLFVLSGYLITSQLRAEFDRSGTIDLKGFWLRRVRRTTPTVVVFLVVTAALCVLFSHILLTKMRPDILPAFLMYLNWAKIFSHESYFAAAGAPSPLTHFWSLAIEWQFYLVWPIVLLLLCKAGVKRCPLAIGLGVVTLASAVAMWVMYVPEADPSRVYYGTDTRAMSLTLGCLMGVLWPFSSLSRKEATGEERIRWEAVAWAGVIGVLALMVFTEGYSGWSYHGGILLASLVSGVAIIGLMPEGTLASRVLSAAPLRWLGSRSYAIYLWHYPIVLLLKDNAAVNGQAPWRVVLMIALTLAASELSYRFVEQPFRHGNFVQTMRGMLPEGSPRDWPRSRQVLGAGCVAVVLIAVLGCALVPGKNAMGGDEGERVSAATLTKPLVDGQYDVVCIGDSVMLGVSELLSESFPHGVVDAKVSRQASEALEVFKGYDEQGVVGDTVIFAVGTNGTLDEQILEDIVAAVGEDRQLWFVNNRMPDSWQDSNNELIQACVDAHDNVGLIDWYGLSADRSDWFWDDGTHIRQQSGGEEAYRDLVLQTTGYIAPTEENTHYDVVFLGDATAMSAADELAAAFPAGVVSCSEGRNAQALTDLYDGYAKQGVVGGTVVIAYGADNPVSEEAVEDLVSHIGEDVQIWLVNGYTSNQWCEDNNEVFAKVAGAHDNVGLIDWHAVCEAQDGYLGDDGVHLTDEGATAYVTTITDTMGYVAPSDDADTEGETDETSSDAVDTDVETGA